MIEFLKILIYNLILRITNGDLILKKTTVASALLIGLLAQSAIAIELGDMAVHSGSNELFNADINVTLNPAKDLQPAEEIFNNCVSTSSKELKATVAEAGKINIKAKKPLTEAIGDLTVNVKCDEVVASKSYSVWQFLNLYDILK